MTDVFTPDKRSEVMSKIRSSGTRIEEQLYQAVRDALGYRWRIDRNVGALPGKPDVVVPTLWLAVFVDGCFYHSCPHHGRIPSSNRDYWEPKLRGNVRRDERNRRRLRSLGYHVWRFWEHDFTGRARATATHRRIEGRVTALVAERRC
jgi:DNA mismatch endonuclease (patch repair protein)